MSSNQEAVRRYQAKLDAFKIRPPLEEGERIRQWAEAHGTSVQALFLTAVREYMTSVDNMDEDGE